LAEVYKIRRLRCRRFQRRTGLGTRAIHHARPLDSREQILQLTQDRWVLEIYRTIIETLQGIAWLLLVFFVFALIAYVIVRVFELKQKKGRP
jgi:hypothetical protein